MRLSAHARNILYLFSGDIASRLVGFLATIYLARILGTEGFGIIHIGLAILTYAMIVSDGGLSFLGVREIAGKSQYPAEFSGQLLLTRFFLSLITFAVASILIVFFIRSPELRNIALVYLLYIFPAALMLEWYFQGKKKMGVVALGRFFGMATYLVFILLFVHQIEDMVNIAWGWTLGVLFNAALLWVIFVGKKNQIRFQWNPGKFRSLFITALPMGVAAIISQVVLQFPALQLGLIASAAEVGIYSAAFKLTALILIFDRVFYAIFFPIISDTFRNKPKMLETVFSNVLRFVSTLALLVGLCVVLSAEFLIEIIFGNAFVRAVPVFQLLTGYFVFTLIASVFTFTLIGMKLERIYTKSLLAGMVAFFSTILVLGPFFGAWGAAMAILLYILISLYVMSIGLKSYMTMKLFRILILPASVTTFIFVPVLMSLSASLLVKLVIAIAICLPAIAYLCGIGTKELSYLKRALIWN